MKLNQRHFNSGFAFATAAVILYLVFFGHASGESVIGMLGGILFNVSLLLSIGFGLQFFQLGTDRDIQKEIFDDGNVAAAIYQLGLWLALAIVISKGLM